MPDSRRKPKPKLRVASTGTSPELVETIPIARARKPGASRTVVLSLGPDSKTDLPLAQALEPGDLLRIYVELELTTDYETKVAGSMGTPYRYAPWIEAVVLLAADGAATAHEPGRAHSIRKTKPIQITHDRHHHVLIVADAEYRVPETGLPWSGPVFVNVALSAAHPNASPDNVLLVGENEPDAPRVDQDTGGIRVVRLNPEAQPAIPARRTRRLRRRAGVPVAKRKTVIISKKLDDLRRGEQLFVHGRLLTDARHTGYKTRISTRLLLVDDKDEVEPAASGRAKQIASWNGHLSKENGFNCLPGEGPQATQKFGVLRVRRDAGRPLFVNFVATSAAPGKNPPETGDDLPVEAESFLDVVRYPAELDR